MTAPDPRLDEIQAIPAEAVEAAARAMAPTAWGPHVWHFMAHGETPTEARDRVQRQSLGDARKALEAAHPVLLAELRKAHEALTRVEALHVPIFEYGQPAGCQLCDWEQPGGENWPCDTRAAVAAANGDGRG